MTYSGIDNGFYKYDFDAEECADALGNGEFQIRLIAGNISGSHIGETHANRFGAGDNNSGTNTKHYRTILKFKTPVNPSEGSGAKITNLFFKVKTGAGGDDPNGDTAVIYAHPITLPTTSIDMANVKWTEYDTGLAWGNRGGDYDDATDYGFGGNGRLISQKMTTDSTNYTYDLSTYVDKIGLDWDTEYAFMFKESTATDGDVSADTYSGNPTLDDTNFTVYVYFKDDIPKAPTITAAPKIGGAGALITVNAGGEADLYDLLTIWRDDGSAPTYLNNPNSVSDVNPNVLDTSKATHFDAGILSAENTRYSVAVYSRDQAASYVATVYGTARSNIIELARPNINSVVINTSFNTIGSEGQLTVAATTGGAWSSYGAASLKYLHILWDGPASGATINDDGVSKIEITDTDATSIAHTHTYSSSGTKYVWVALEDTNGFMSGFHRIDDADTQFTVSSASYNNDPTITHASSTAIKKGMFVSGTGIPAGAYVASVTDATHFELSVSTTGGSLSGQTLTFNWIDTLATLPAVSEANPICNITTSKSKLLAAKYADYNTGLIVSASQSKAVGTTSKLQNYLFTCKAGHASTIVTMGAFDNNNDVFDSASKRVCLRALTDIDVSAARIKLTGLASFDASGDPIADNSATFRNYKMVSEAIGAPDAVLTEGTSSTNYFKTIESAVVTTVDDDDTEGVRYILTAKIADWDYVDTGVTINEADDGSELDLSVTDAEPFRAGDVVVIDGEYMKVTASDTDNNRLQITRQYLGSATNSGVGSGAAVAIANPIVINSEIRWASAPTDSDYWVRYRWGGFVRIKGSTLGSGTAGIDFEPFAGSTDTATNTIILQEIASDYSSFNGLCWYEQGFFDDDIIIIGNTSNNGSYATPKYFKLASFITSANSDYETAIIHGSNHDLPSWVSHALENEDDTGADIIRVISNPSRTVAAVNVASPAEKDSILFEARVIDDDATSLLVNTDLDLTSVNLVQPIALDLNTVGTYGHLKLTTADISILNADINRDGGLTTVMPLGERKYPLGVTRTSMGLPTMSVNLRIHSQAAYRSIISLIEGDTYDYVFIDSTQVDTPTTAYVTYRMKYIAGDLRKSPETTNEYLASINFVIVGEAVTV